VRTRGVRLAGASRGAVALALSVFAVALTACGDTLQDQPIPHNTLESLMAAPYPVYWLGGSFQGLSITEASHDPGGAFAIQYGDCRVGGQGTCVPPLRVITSPDNSFVPGGSAAQQMTNVRGVAAIIARAGKEIEIPTGGVVVGIYALTAHLAGTAAATIVPINEIEAPGAQLLSRRPDTGFAKKPLPSQIPPQLRTLP
jgi:hypothetical protein